MLSNKLLSGRYELIEKIGEGGMAVVYKAKCRLLNRFVAIKILKPEFIKDSKFIESFRRESQAAASLSHQNIVNVYDVGIEGKNIHFIVMEYIEGEVLSDIIAREGPLPVDQAVNIAKQIASALGHAHRNHIIHRDIKPHNIMITKDGIAKVTDFGIAKAVNSTTIVNNNSVMGSVHYFSPEQARGGYVDEKSDIYSLGIVLYEMVTGKVPFDGENPISVAMKHINDEMIPPGQLNDKIPKSLETVIMKAANKYQTNRYKNAKEFQDALEGILCGETDEGCDASDKSATRVVPAINGDEMREKKIYSKKRTKINYVKISAIFLALIAAFFMSKSLLFLKDIVFAEEIKVPNVVGMDYEEAQKSLEAAGLTVDPNMERQYSDEYPSETVIKQEPNADMEVKKGFAVKLTISKGGKTASVPNLINKKLEDAQFFIENSGFSLGTVTEEFSDFPVGIVIGQDPEYKDDVPKNTKINLVVSKGPQIKKVYMMDLIGKNIDTAKKEIEKAGLKQGSIDYAYDSQFSKNTVIKQSIPAETEVEQNTKVDLVVSKGPDPSQTNSTDSEDKQVSLNIPFDDAKNEVFVIKIYKIQNGTVEIVHDDVHYKSAGGETITVSGSGQARLTIYFDDVLIDEKNLDFDTGQFYD